jgi:hypothetical protein
MSARIEELVLRIPGISAGEARVLVDEVVRRVRAGLPDSFQPVTLPRVHVRLALPRGAAREQLAERIARAVLDQLQPTGAGS